MMRMMKVKLTRLLPRRHIRATLVMFRPPLMSCLCQLRRIRSPFRSLQGLCFLSQSFRWRFLVFQHLDCIRVGSPVFFDWGYLLPGYVVEAFCVFCLFLPFFLVWSDLSWGLPSPWLALMGWRADWLGKVWTSTLKGKSVLKSASVMRRVLWV